jgi:sodium transport system ATP-binding protein
VIEVDDVQRRFVHGRGRRARVVQAVAGASFSAADGCITGLLGSNGAGKTTTLRMVAGLLVPDAGRCGRRHRRGGTHRRPRWPGWAC